MNIPVICQSVPEKSGLYLNTYYYPMGAYELWVDAHGVDANGSPVYSLYKHGWFAASEYEDPMPFIKLWLSKIGISLD